ncbi:hypothetical protein [Endozoicomonas elysicola]|uniref:Uncharacterized protein n=1 Tax=Endozoicomonas elysicola TaxID=305900 RepID=A0A081KAU3_9GAMM|nr:hypothetical protein [Endozoicomonas elysicola]KEI71269.1 hypothetical protein GV64_11410 [Endozoicomonas elysicola]
MFFKKKVKYKLYLGQIEVVERRDLKRFLDQSGYWGGGKLNEQLYHRLLDIFDLPLAKSLSVVSEQDLAIDIAIPGFQGGAAFIGSLDATVFPVFWRPKVQVNAKIYTIETGQTLHQVEVVSKMAWKTYLQGIISPRALLGLFPPFGIKDLEPLLFESCYKAVTRLRAKY